MYTITGLRESAGNRGLVSFLFEVEAGSPEEALEKCGVAFGSYDVTSGDAVFTPGQFADVQVTSTEADEVQPCLEVPSDPQADAAEPVNSSDVAVAAESEVEAEAGSSAVPEASPEVSGQ
jgi:hypothetical protein